MSIEVVEEIRRWLDLELLLAVLGLLVWSASC
jgi:hypothetical protein